MTKNDLDSTMKVCFVIPGFGEGGAQRQCILLINELLKNKKLEIHLILFYEGVYWDSLDTRNLKIHKGRPGSMMSFVAMIFVWRSIRKIRPNIIFSWLHSTDVFVGLMKIVGLSSSSRWIMAERNSFYPKTLGFMLREYLGRFADNIACNSNKGKIYWQSLGINPLKITTHDNIVFSPKIFQRDFGVSRDIDILYAGRLESQKNIEFMGAALDALLSHRSLSICIIGNGSLKQCLIDILAGNNEVQIMPFQKNIFDYYKRAKIFVSLSLHEGLPNVVIENISIGNRVVVSNIPEHVEILGEDYPFYWHVGSPIDEAVRVIENALEADFAIDYYQYAKNRLKNMTSSNVAVTYENVFNSLSH
jgi:glycosyltransferase involved in cell wall biosynthesis